METTLLRAAIDATQSIPEELAGAMMTPAQLHRERTLFTLDHLAEFADVEGPVFVFAHLFAPHSPYVLGAVGEAVSDLALLRPESAAEHKRGYRNQVSYLNARLVETVQRIIDNSSPAPVIIQQGDHWIGFGSRTARMSILKSVYLPPDRTGSIPSTLSPVNPFRLVFNRVFGAQLPILADLSYFSYYDRPYDFVVIPNECEAPASMDGRIATTAGLERGRQP